MPGPMYRQIAEDLRRKIESGELGQGTQLPTEMELREHYEASRNTVRDAVRWLVIRGLVETRPGHGTFVRGEVEPFLTSLLTAPNGLPVKQETGLGGETRAYAAEVHSQGRRPEVSVPRVEIQQASLMVRAELQLSAAAVVSRHQERRIDGFPYSLQTTFYPMAFVQRGAVRLVEADDIRPGALAYLEDVLGIRQIGWRDKITVRAAGANETAFFQLPDDGRIGVFETLRTGFDESGRPLRLTVTSYPTDRNQFVMDVGSVPPQTIPSPEKPDNVRSLVQSGR
jgi:GntR family transcriptional regulator